VPYSTTIVLVKAKRLENYYALIYTQFFEIVLDGEITDLIVRLVIYMDEGRFAAVDCQFETILHERDVYYD
jgi:hypothetical protein